MRLLFLRFSVDSPFYLKRPCEFHSFVYFLASRLWFVALNPGFIDYHQRRRNSFLLRLNSVKLDYNSLSCACWSKLSYKQYLMQDIIHAVFWAVYCLSSLAHLQRPVCEYEIVDFYVTLFFVVAVCGTHRSLVKPMFVSFRQSRSLTVTMFIIQALFFLSAWFPFQKPELNNRSILIFLHFSKICEHAFICSQNRTTT